MEEANNLKSNLTKKRIPIIALIFSLLAPGLGQVYNGQFYKAITLILFLRICSLIFFVTGLISTFGGLVIATILELSIIICIIVDAIIVSTNSKIYKKKSYNKWYYYIFIFIVFSLISYVSLNHGNKYFKSYKIVSSSMEESLLIGDRIASNERYFNNRKIQRFNLIIFKDSRISNPDIKRVIGLPGDKIEIINKKVYLNDKFIEQTFVKYIDESIISRDNGRIFWDDKFLGSRDNFGPITVSENHYFALGDNRDVSADSRYLGLIKKENIIGYPLYILFSYGSDPIQDYKNYLTKYSKNLKSKYPTSKHLRWSRFGKNVE